MKPIADELFEHRGLNAEMRWGSVNAGTYVTPNDRFFVRSQSSTPVLDRETWRMKVEGSGVVRPVELDFERLSSLPQVTRVRALECAGNGRKHFASNHSVTPLGTQWGLGAIGVARWTGVRLRDVLDLAEVTSSARSVMPEGLDEDRVCRPMPLSKALEDDTLLVFEMNGEPLPVDHGAPVRVLVPGWVAAASIKWVGRIVVSDTPMWSRWNTEIYVLAGGDHPQGLDGRWAPLESQVIKSALELEWGARVGRGFQWIHGRAWSPHGRIARVDVSVDSAEAWVPARLVPPNLRRAWARFDFGWVAPPGDHTLRVRATDEHGNRQPDMVAWNDHGYLYGGIVEHPLSVR